MKEEIYNLIIEICKLCIDINLQTKLACWFEITGHVSWLEIRIGEGKNDGEYEKKIFKKSLDYKEWSSLEDFKKIKKELEEILGNYNAQDNS
jgi:hypothetical protein